MLIRHVVRGVRQSSVRVAWDTFMPQSLPQAVAAASRMADLNRKLRDNRYRDKAGAVSITINAARWACDVAAREKAMREQGLRRLSWATVVRGGGGVDGSAAVEGLLYGGYLVVHEQQDWHVQSRNLLDALWWRDASTT